MANPKLGKHPYTQLAKLEQAVLRLAMLMPEESEAGVYRKRKANVIDRLIAAVLKFRKQRAALIKRDGP
jgi:hypothetical protein